MSENSSEHNNVFLSTPLEERAKRDLKNAEEVAANLTEAARLAGVTHLNLLAEYRTATDTLCRAGRVLRVAKVKRDSALRAAYAGDDALRAAQEASGRAAVAVIASQCAMAVITAHAKEKAEAPTVTVSYRPGVEREPERQDAAFFTGQGLLAVVSHKGFAIEVFCEGETRAHLLEARPSTVVRTLRSPSDFIDAGLTTDNALQCAEDQGLLTWENNAWFELYRNGESFVDWSATGIHIVLNEAIADAVTYVKNNWAIDQLPTLASSI